MGYTFHESAFIDLTVSIKDNTYIGHYSIVDRNATIGKNTTIGKRCYISGGSVIGDGVYIGNNVDVVDKVKLEDNVYCGNSVCFTTKIFPRAATLNESPAFPIFISTGASVGDGSIVLAGVTVGSNAFIAPGSLIAKDVLPHALMSGSPAVQRGWVCQCGKPLVGSNLACPCGKEYSLMHQGRNAFLIEK